MACRVEAARRRAGERRTAPRVGALPPPIQACCGPNFPRVAIRSKRPCASPVHPVLEHA